jgi:hypothetical protein
LQRNQIAGNNLTFRLARAACMKKAICLVDSKAGDQDCRL